MLNKHQESLELCCKALAHLYLIYHNSKDLEIIIKLFKIAWFLIHLGMDVPRILRGALFRLLTIWFSNPEALCDSLFSIKYFQFHIEDGFAFVLHARNILKF